MNNNELNRDCEELGEGFCLILKVNMIFYFSKKQRNYSTSWELIDRLN
jgi:hypothetical protein